MTTSSGAPGAPQQHPPQQHGPLMRVLRSVELRTTLLSVLLALVLGALLVAAADEATLEALGYVTARPSDMFVAAWDAVSGAYLALLDGAVGSGRALAETLSASAPLILAGIAVGVPLRAGLFNIGGEGQIIAGGAVAGLVGFALLDVPALLHVPLALAGGLLAGAAIGAVPGLLKARTGAHEVITTIMMNRVLSALLAAALLTDLFQKEGAASAISKTVQASSRIPGIDGARLDAGILLALLAALGMWFLIERSSIGFQIRAVGANAVAAVTAGMSAARTTVLTFAVAGASAGLAGAVLVLGSTGPGAVTPTFSSGIGFDGITVALLGRGKAGGTVAAGLLFGALRAGGTQMQARTGTPVDLVVVVQALVILFVAAPMVIQSLFRMKSSGESGPQVAQGWGA